LRALHSARVRHGDTCALRVCTLRIEGARRRCVGVSCPRGALGTEGVCRGKGVTERTGHGARNRQRLCIRRTRRRRRNACSRECARPPGPQPCAPHRCTKRTAVQGNNTNAPDNSLHRQRRARRTQAHTNRVAHASPVQWAARVPDNFCPILKHTFCSLEHLPIANIMSR
jgi:hypothetical protein